MPLTRVIAERRRPIFSGPERIEAKGGVSGRAAYVEFAILEFGAGPVIVRLNREALQNLTRRAFAELARAEKRLAAGES